MADARDGPIVFLVNKGLPPFPVSDLDNYHLSIVNIGDHPVAVRMFNVYVRPSGVMATAEAESKLPSGTVVGLMGAGEMRTLQVGGFLTYPMDVQTIVRVLRSDDSPSDEGVRFAMECSIVGDERPTRFGWPKLTVSRRALFDRAAKASVKA